MPCRGLFILVLPLLDGVEGTSFAECQEHGGGPLLARKYISIQPEEANAEPRMRSSDACMQGKVPSAHSLHPARHRTKDLSVAGDKC